MFSKYLRSADCIVWTAVGAWTMFIWETTRVTPRRARVWRRWRKIEEGFKGLPRVE